MNEQSKQAGRRYGGSNTHQEFHAGAPLIGQICLHNESTSVTLQVVLHVTMVGFKKVRH